MRRAALFLIIASACHSGVHGIGSEPEALVTIHGRLTAPPRELKRPHAAIMWAGIPVFVQFCHDFGPTPLDPDRESQYVATKGCRDPFEVVPGAAGPSVRLARDQTTFEIALEHLPDASLMVGELGRRVAYASLVIFDDLDGDGELTLSPRCPRFQGDEMRPDERPPRDLLYASSFTILTNEQRRLAYVEGDFDAASFYYPHPNCTDLPPRGFSTWVVGDLLDPNASCRVDPIEQEITLDFARQGSLLDLSCVASERDTFPRPPPDGGIPRSVVFECLPDGTLVTADPECPCPNLRIYSLRGCFNDAACPIPDWDVDPPKGWPCSQH